MTIIITATDNAGLSVADNYLLSVEVINTAPTAVNDAAIVTDENVAINNINAIANDTDPDGDIISVIEATAFNGTVSINADSTFNYVPNVDYNGPDIISYTISDGSLTDSSMFAVMVNDIDPIALVQDYPLSFSAQVISAKYASIDIYGDNYATSVNDSVIKLTLTADMANVTNYYVNSISGVEVDLNIDWTQFEVLSYTDGTSASFESQSALDASLPSIWQTYTDDSGNLNKLIVASIDTTANPAKTLVDNIDSTGLGVTDRPSVLELGSIYLKPIAGLDDYY